jgi:hypothetical protein
MLYASIEKYNPFTEDHEEAYTVTMQYQEREQGFHF